MKVLTITDDPSNGHPTGGTNIFKFECITCVNTITLAAFENFPDVEVRIRAYDRQEGIKINQVSTGMNPEITTCGSHGFMNGDIVTISGTTSQPPIDGTWNITVTGPTTFTISPGFNVTVAGFDNGLANRIIFETTSGVMYDIPTIVPINTDRIMRLEVFSENPIGILELCYCRARCVVSKRFVTLTDCWRFAQDDDGNLCLQFYSKELCQWITPVGKISSKIRKTKCQEPLVNVAVVVDCSGSITVDAGGDPSNAGIIRDGLNYLIDTLSGSESTIAITSFATISPTLVVSDMSQNGYYGFPDTLPTPNVIPSGNSYDTTTDPMGGQSGIIGGYFPVLSGSQVAAAENFINTRLQFATTDTEPPGAVDTNNNEKFTNWQAGFMSVQGPNCAQIRIGLTGPVGPTGMGTVHFDGPLTEWPDVVLFITDGVPNTFYTGTDGAYDWSIPVGPVVPTPVSGTTRNNQTLGFQLGQKESKYIQNYTRVIGLGVGQISDPANLQRLIDVVTPTGPTGAVENQDYFCASTIPQFRQTIDALVATDAFCNGFVPPFGCTGANPNPNSNPRTRGTPGPQGPPGPRGPRGKSCKRQKPKKCKKCRC
jgi:hypothetical protein